MERERQQNDSLANVARNYPCDNLIASFFGLTGLAALDSDPPGAPTLMKQMYQCMLSQALGRTDQ